MEQVLNLILSKLDNIEKTIDNIEKRVDSIESDVKEIKSDVTEIRASQNRLEARLEDLDSKNAKNHITMMSMLKTTYKDVKFVKHKLYQTEEDVFDIKDYLKIVK